MHLPIRTEPNQNTRADIRTQHACTHTHRQTNTQTIAVNVHILRSKTRAQHLQGPVPALRPLATKNEGIQRNQGGADAPVLQQDLGRSFGPADLYLQLFPMPWAGLQQCTAHLQPASKNAHGHFPKLNFLALRLSPGNRCCSSSSCQPMEMLSELRAAHAAKRAL